MLTATARRRAGATLVVLQTLPTLAIAALVPVLPTLFTRFADLPHRELLVPMILTLPSLCVAVFSSLLGLLTDRYGRRRVLLPSLLAFALFGLGPFLAQDMAGLLVTRFFVGIAEAGVLTVTNSLMGDYFDGDERRIWLARQTIVGPVAAFVYVGLGGLLAHWSWRGPFLIYLLGLAVLVVALRTLPEPTRMAASESRTSWRGFPWRAAAAVGGVTTLLSMVFFVQNVQHGRIFSDLGAHDPQLIAWLINGATCGSFVGGFMYRYVKLDVRRYLAVALLAYGIGYVGLSLVPGYGLGVLFDGVAQIGASLTIPVLIAWALSRFPEEHRGRGIGLWATGFFIGEFLSPLTLTLIGHGSWSFLRSVGAVGVLCLAVALLLAALPGNRAAAAR